MSALIKKIQETATTKTRWKIRDREHRVRCREERSYSPLLTEISTHTWEIFCRQIGEKFIAYSRATCFLIISGYSVRACDHMCVYSNEGYLQIIC